MNINNNQNNNHDNNKYLNQLYNLVWNNIYIKRNILFHLYIYNTFKVNIKFYTIEDWIKFKHKEYLKEITLNFHFKLGQDQLPENIKIVNVISANILSPNGSIAEIPDHIESINISKMNMDNLKLMNSALNSTATTSKINNLSLKVEECEQIEPNSIPQSVSSMVISCFDYKLFNNVLPKGLIKLSVYEVLEFEDGCLPESLTDFSAVFIPSLMINQFSNSLIKLNIITLDVNTSIRFPSSLLYLDIRCYSFNTSLPVNLKSLEFTCSNIVGKDGQSILPQRLERLILNVDSTFNQTIQMNQLPSSLTYLDLGPSFNQVINVDILPSGLKTLKLGYRYTQIINPLAIPSQLRLLEINNDIYDHPIDLLSTHPNTLISNHNLSLYYQSSNTDIRVLRLPNKYKQPLSTLQLQDKSQLEYLHLGYEFNHPIELSDLPINNQIKTLELSDEFTQTINLEYFQHLETIIINYNSFFWGKPIPPKIITTTTIYNNNNNNNNNNITYNNYNLKNIIVPSSYSQFLVELDDNFYKFIKFYKTTN